MSNKGHENLIPQAHVLTVDEQSAGGRKSAEVRRERRKAKDTLNALLALPVSDGTALDPEQLTCIKDKQNTDVNTQILIQLINSALHGNIRAIQEIYTLTQERNTRMQIESDLSVDESYRKLQELFDDFGRTESACDHVDREQQSRMFEWWCYRDNPEDIARRFTSADLEQIKTLYATADEWMKIDIVQMILATDKIPDEDAIMLFDNKYQPEVMEHFKTQEPPQEPQTLDEYFERIN